ncbi:bifunctional Zinc-binding ribosomal protein/Ribosomal protein L37e [Babesia duncani]|uniref:Ribosomal protein L37 n=1 Tax=Babesia duncani TaxID=323732 RepID=A0AAD9UPE4_9APIC|nr:bifunctional Zinc-binding ribosomal protein/Ribosomal protein L37e [Babesia duncani]
MGKCGKGTGSFGLRNVKTHGLCKRCGNRAFHIQKQRCGSCAFPDKKMRRYNWSAKAIRRKKTGTGRCRYLKHLPRRARNNFREGTRPPARKKGAAGNARPQTSTTTSTT